MAETPTPEEALAALGLQKQKNLSLDEELRLLEAQADVLGRNKESIEHHLEVSRLVSADLEAQLKAETELLTVVEKGSEEYEEQLKLVKEINKKLLEEKKTQDHITGQLDKQKQLEQERKQIIQTTVGLTENFAQQLGFAGKNANSINQVFSGIEKQLANSLKSGKGLKGAFKGFGKGAADAATSVFSLGSFLGRTVGGMGSAALRMNKAREEMVAMGFSFDEAGKIIKAADSDFEKIGGTMVGLGQRMKQLNEGGMTKLKESLGTDTIKRLDMAAKAGLDFGDATQFLNQQMTQMGKPLNVAMDELGDLQVLSKDLGQDLGKTTKDWVKFSDRINQSGPKSQKVFKRMAELAKASGIEMGKLFEVAAGFDTIEGAAEATARLNIVLGTQLDSLELTQMDDDERMYTIREAIKAKGGLEQLNAREIRMLEDGFQGRVKISEIMGLTNDVTATGTDLAADNAKATEEAAKAGADAVNAMAKMQNEALARMRKEAEEVGVDVAIDKITGAWARMSTKMQIGLDFVLSAIGTLASLGLTAIATGASVAIGGAEVGAGATAMGAGVGMGAAEVGAGVGLMLSEIALGLATMANPATIVGALIVIGVLQSLALVILAVGVAIGLAAAGMSLLVDAISGAAADRLMAFGAMMSEILMSINPIGLIFIGIKKVVEQVGKTFEVVARSAGSFADAIVKVAQAAQGMTLSSMAGWARFATNLSEVVGAINDVEIDEMEAFRKTLNVVVAGTIGKGANAPGSSVQGNVTVQVIMDNDVFARAVSKIVDNKLNGLPSTSP